MREIKFRVWNTDSNEWVSNENKQSETKLNYSSNYLVKWHPYILEQYTGLKDKNGVEIYEGDIVQYKESEQGEKSEFYHTKKRVNFNKGSFGFEEWGTDNEGNLTENNIHHPERYTTRAFYYVKFDIEIIGNIHENKDLK